MVVMMIKYVRRIMLEALARKMTNTSIVQLEGDEIRQCDMGYPRR